MFDKYSPLKKKIFRLIDHQGKIVNQKEFEDDTDKILEEGLKRILLTRTVDLRAVSYQRQGRMFTYPPNLGQEAATVAAGMVMRDEDWLVPAYRELGAWLAKGVTLKEMFLYWSGHEDGSRHTRAKNVLPIAVPIASQLLHATGIGYALKYQKKPGVVFGFCGDGGTSEGDFHEALNFAGVWNVPVVFVIQNNGYAISCPFEKQTAAESVAIKSVAYGIKGIQVDGNDLAACHQAFKLARDHAEKHKEPVLVEAVTYRAGAHTTSDDPGRYRTKEEEESWKDKDPVIRLRNYLTGKKRWDEADEEKLMEQYGKEVDAAFAEVENYPDYPVEDVFKYQYAEMPDDLKAQLVEYQKFMKWKESQQ